VVAVPDPRLDTLAGLAKLRAHRSSTTQLGFVDIAGLVKRRLEAAKGLGNQFLSHIREVDAIIHVLRCFEDGDVTHVSGTVDPVSRRRDRRDRADAGRSWTALEKRVDPLVEEARRGDDEADAEGAGST
jgi:hypothetical protein